MPAILEIPQVVEDSLDQFADLFANQPQRRHFAEYLTGLMVASNKTVVRRRKAASATRWILREQVRPGVTGGIVDADPRRTGVLEKGIAAPLRPRS